MTGATESGKSHLTRALFLTAAAPRTIIDPADSDLTRVPRARTFSDPGRWADFRDGTSRFVPTDPFDVEVYDALYRAMFNSGPRFVWVDEGGIVLPVTGGPKAGRVFLVQGRKRELGQIVCHTRPREVDANVIAQAAHVAIFDTPNPDDRRRLAELAGIAPRQLDELLGELVEFGFVWWDRRAKRLTVCDPLPR